MSVSFKSLIYQVHAGSFVTEDFTPSARISTEMFLFPKQSVTTAATAEGLKGLQSCLCHGQAC